MIDFLKIENDVYTVMDFVEGQSFEQMIKEKKTFTKEKILKYTRQLCEVMAYLHKQKPPILHGDIKPANIMLKPDDNICLIDFNIAGFLSDGVMVTVGYSAGYASPEQCQAVQSLGNSDFYTRQSAKKTEEETVLQQSPVNIDEDVTLLSNRQEEVLTKMSAYPEDNKKKSPLQNGRALRWTIP